MNSNDNSKIEWLKRRQCGIGGSDVGAIMGVNSYKSAYEVYLDKISEIEKVEPESEAAYWGTKLEEIVATEFHIRTGKKVRRDNKHLVHKDYPFMVANIDRRIVGENSILECKTANSFMTKEWEADEVPASYLLQCQHYLAVTGANKCYIAVLIGGQKFIFKEIERDEELINLIIDAEKTFWIEYVEKRVEPPIDGSFGATRYINNKFKYADKGKNINLNSDINKKIHCYFELKEQIKLLDENIKEIENVIKNTMKEAEKGIANNYIVTWKNVSSSRVDSKKLKEVYPEVFKEVSKLSLSRRFEVKKV